MSHTFQMKFFNWFLQLGYKWPSSMDMAATVRPVSNCRLCEGGSDQFVINDPPNFHLSIEQNSQLLELSVPNLKKSFSPKFAQNCVLGFERKYN